MKALLLFSTLLIFACSKDNLNPPQPESRSLSKGVFGLRDAQKLTELGAEYTRILIWDSDVKAIYEEVDQGTPIASIPQYKQIKAIADAGIKIILTFRWPDQNSSDPALYDRVPLGQDRTESIALLQRFMNDFGTLLRVYSIQNEVGGLGPGTYAQADMENGPDGIPAINWWKDIVSVIDSSRANNTSLAELKISSPVPVLLKRLVFNNAGLPQVNIDFFYACIDFANSHCDYLDLHFNTLSLAEHEAALDFIKPLVRIPMIATEWSEVNTTNTYVAKQVSSDLRTKAQELNYTIPTAPYTNDELIEQLYTTPGPAAMWDFMLMESAYESNFMKQSSSLLQKAGFKVLCWNSGWQEGLTAYDLRSFYATKTVFGSNHEIKLFTDEFKEL